MLHLAIKITKNTLVFIDRFNNQSPSASYELGHNQFSDFTWEEYKAYNKLGNYNPGLQQLDQYRTTSNAAEDAEATRVSRRQRQLQWDRSNKGIPDSVNWVELGAIPPIKNQGMCGSCWAFSAIGAIEGAHFVDTGDLIALSEQQLVDCDPLDLGCSGGLMDNAFLFDENSTGICSEMDYPYVQHKRWFRGCASAKGLCIPQNHTRVDTFVDVKNTVEDLMAAIADQPVSIAIEADRPSFQFYRKVCSFDTGTFASRDLIFAYQNTNVGFFYAFESRASTRIPTVAIIWIMASWQLDMEHQTMGRITFWCATRGEPLGVMKGTSRWLVTLIKSTELVVFFPLHLGLFCEMTIRTSS